MKKVLITLLFIASIAACTKKEDIEIPTDEGKIYATTQNFEDSGTKVQLDKEMKTVWNSNDIIKIFTPSKISDYKFDGETGDHTGSFSWLSDSGTCEGVDSVSYAIYPVESYLGHISTNNFRIGVNLKDIQEYKEGSFGEGINIMLGKSTDGINYSFENFLGYLRLSITGDKKVRSITVSGNSFEDTAGDLYFFADRPSNWIWSFDGEIYGETTIDCGDEGVLLSPTEPTHFYIAFPPMKFIEGATFTIKYTDETIYPHSTSSTIVIEQNQILQLETINTNATQWQTVEIFHRNTEIETPVISALADVTTLSGIIDFGDGNSVNLSDLENTHKYNDGKESHIISIKVKDANAITLNSCKGVSKIDFSNF